MLYAVRGSQGKKMLVAQLQLFSLCKVHTYLLSFHSERETKTRAREGTKTMFSYPCKQGQLFLLSSARAT